MKICFLIGSPAISGGSYVIYQHALKCLEKKLDVVMITEEKIDMSILDWHKDAKKLTWKTYEEVKHECFDLVICTWWRTFYEMYRVNGKKYVYFVQSIESRFYDENEKALRKLCESTYMLNIPVITEATWIKNYLEDNYNMNVHLVRNGVRKDIYVPDTNKLSDKFRVLVEGPLNVPFKNVERTIELVRQSMAQEIYLLTSTPNVKEYDGVSKIYSCVPIEKTAELYQACDVLVKLSYVEGMFGPPLEMFHCGGTAITYDVDGHDEYMINDYNSIIIKTDDERGVIDAINELKMDRDKLKLLKKNALETANNWNCWNQSSENFYEQLMDINENYLSVSQTELKNKSQFLFDFYVVCEKSRAITNPRLRKVLKHIEYNYPNVTARLVKIKNFLGIKARLL